MDHSDNSALRSGFLDRYKRVDEIDSDGQGIGPAGADTPNREIVKEK